MINRFQFFIMCVAIKTIQGASKEMMERLRFGRSSLTVQHQGLLDKLLNL